jgi:AraC-like DNA-binding protein
VIVKILDIIIYAGILQGFFLAFVLHRAKGALRSPNSMLSALLIVLSCAIIHSVFIIPHMEHIIGNPIKIKEPFLLLIGPMLYFYTRRLFGLDTLISARHGLHLIPFLLFFVISLPFFLHSHTSPYMQFFTTHVTPIAIIVWILFVAQYGAYLWAIKHIIHNHIRKAREEFSNVEDSDPSWVRFFMMVFLVLLVFLMVVLFSIVHFGGFSGFERTISLLFSVSIFALGYKGLFQKGLFLPPAETRETTQPEPARLASSVSGEDGSKRIIAFVEENKPYLDPDLTLTELAGALGMGRNQLSEMINSELGTNFYDFINKYRVDEVKRLLRDISTQNMKIIAIAFEAGFPSKSSFNNIFKKYTGLTPSEYRDRLS